MKKITAMFLALIMCLGIAQIAFAADTNKTALPKPFYTIKDVELESTMHVIKGVIPSFADITDEDFSTQINKIVTDFYDKVMLSAKSQNGLFPDVFFSYETYGDDKYLSIVLHGSVNPGNTSTDIVETFVLDKTMYKLYTLKDILGENAYKIASKFVKKTMAANPDGYLHEIVTPPIDQKTKFYIDNGSNLVIIFDKYAIAPGASGTPTFIIPLKNYLSIGLPADSTYFKGNIRMVPMRKLLEIFRYEIAWNGDSATVKVGGIFHLITPGIAKYKDADLATAPEIKDNSLYIPINMLPECFGIEYTANTNLVMFSKLLDVATASAIITGTITDATMNTITIKAVDGRMLTFMTEAADKSGVNGMTIGKQVTIHYTGTIVDSNTENASVTKIIE